MTGRWTATLTVALGSNVPALIITCTRVMSTSGIPSGKVNWKYSAIQRAEERGNSAGVIPDQVVNLWSDPAHAKLKERMIARVLSHEMNVRRPRPSQSAACLCALPHARRQANARRHAAERE